MRTTSKRTVRRALTGLAMIVLVAVSGVASAVTPASVYRAGSVDQAATFRVVDRQDGATHPTNLQLALVGKVAIFARVTAYASANPDFPGNIELMIGARNQGPNWVALAFPRPEGAGVGQAWIAPGQQDAWLAGEVLNDTVPGPGVHGTNGIDTIGIIDEFGRAASGTIAWSASVAPNGAARVTFTVNLRG